MITIKDVIMNDILKQREELITTTLKLIDQFDSYEEFNEWIEDLVFSEKDILMQHLQSLSLDFDDIDPDSFRDAQHDTIIQCCDYFKELRNED